MKCSIAGVVLFACLGVLATVSLAQTVEPAPGQFASGSRMVWIHYAKTSGYVAVDALGAWLFVWFVNAKRPAFLSQRIRRILAITGTFCLLVAGLGGLGWTIQTFDGNTPPERLNQTLLQCFVHAGAFLILVDLIWSFSKKSERNSA